jgi:predicted HAD superfamily phosphohydrolase YqeG
MSLDYLPQNVNTETLIRIMAEEQAAHHLLNVLEERGLNVDLDRILLGFEDAETKHQSAAWVEEYLYEDTLLTKEELEL